MASYHCQLCYRRQDWKMSLPPTPSVLSGRLWGLQHGRCRSHISLCSSKLPQRALFLLVISVCKISLETAVCKMPFCLPHMRGFSFHSIILVSDHFPSMFVFKKMSKLKLKQLIFKNLTINVLLSSKDMNGKSVLIY